MQKRFPSGGLALVCLLLISGCVGIKDYERKVSESTGLRKEVEAAQARIGSQQKTTENLRKQIQTRRLEGEELSQSLSMSRRHGQQLEASMADLRAQLSSQTQENKSVQAKAARLEAALEQSRQQSDELGKNIVGLRKRVAKFEDKLRLQIQLERDIAAQFSTEVKKNLIKVRRVGDQVMLSLESSQLFASGSAALRSRGKKLLKRIASKLRRHTNREIQVQGHTDNDPISGKLAERWESNWELSAARATRVVRYLVEVGNVDPRKISAAGLGEFRPIAENSSREGKKKNRRIDIVLFPPSS
jgi:chemotaxis protein MotB